MQMRNGLDETQIFSRHPDDNDDNDDDDDADIIGG